MPTFAELAGASTPPAIDGRSFRATLLGQPRRTERQYLYWDYGHTRGAQFAQAVRFGDWKAVRRGSPTAAIELYNLADDPGETRDLARRQPEMVARAQQYMREAFVPSPDYPVGAAP
jgi:arylsulfatase A-like enzyme